MIVHDSILCNTRLLPRLELVRESIRSVATSQIICPCSTAGHCGLQSEKITVHSLSFIRALCLLNRLCFLGEEAVAAAGKRDLTRRLEEGRRRDILFIVIGTVIFFIINQLYIEAKNLHTS